MKTWFKGGLIGIGIGVILLILYELCNYYCTEFGCLGCLIFSFYSLILLLPFRPIINSFLSGEEGRILLNTYFFPIYYILLHILIGVFIGWLIGKIKSRKK
ncbi:MAG: hypothetical protein WC867_01930 [Candidatus Pacearchaeota archaeon]|jgi:hypothetical protein